MKFKIASILLLFAAVSTLVVAAESFGGLKLSKRSFLSPDEAFKVSAKKNGKNIKVDIKLGDKIYIYSKDLHFKVSKPIQIELSPVLPEPKKHGKDIIYRSITVDIPVKKIESKVNSDYTLTVEMTGCSDSGICYQPQKMDIEFKYEGEPKGFFAKISSLTKDGNSAKITEVLTKENIFFILFLFFIFGLLLALTPCIFPMIPILSSIIISQAGKNRSTVTKTFFTSLVYVISMALTYTVVGIVAGLVGADIQAAMAKPWVIILFSGLFVALAFSMFGFYEIGLPAKWQSKLSLASDNAKSKGIVGTAIMGVLSALIVGPCVAPPLGGAILFISQTGDAVLGGLALFVMSMGMGVPLLLVGLGAGKFMPKPGGWMMRISQIFGVMMLLMALYMLERLLPDWLTLLLASLIFMGSAFYMEVFGSCQSRKGLSKLTTLFAFVMLIYGVILLIGAISGANSILHPLERFTTLSKGAVDVNINNIKSDKAHKGYSVKRLLKEVREASAEGKGVVVDIYKDGCAACIELENITFPDPRVQEQMARFRFIRIDITDNTLEDQTLLKKYGLFGAPNILFFDSKGNVLPEKFYTGFIPPEQFAEQMKSIR